MDPLSVRASMANIKRLRDAPKELLSLINETSDFQIVLLDIQNYITQNTQRHQSSQELGNLPTLVDRAKEELLEVEQLIHYRLFKPESRSDQIRVSRLEWLKNKSTVGDHRQSLRDIRSNITTQMMVINSCVSCTTCCL